MNRRTLLVLQTATFVRAEIPEWINATRQTGIEPR